jgi:hypothetical protein
MLWALRWTLEVITDRQLFIAQRLADLVLLSDLLLGSRRVGGKDVVDELRRRALNDADPPSH